MVILFDLYNLPDDIYEIIFSTKSQYVVGKLLIDMMKEHSGEITKSQMSLFATKLHDGTLVEEEETNPNMSISISKKKVTKLSYNKRQFYDRILTPMKSMGLIDYDLYKKTYKISDRFNKILIRIGLLWLQELKKPIGIKFKEKLDQNSR
jgi:hypothetical protein